MDTMFFPNNDDDILLAYPNAKFPNISENASALRYCITHLAWLNELGICSPNFLTLTKNMLNCSVLLC